MNKEQIIKTLEKYNLPKNEYVILAGAALVMYGIKDETNDIDIVVTKELEAYLLDNYETEIKWQNEKNGKNIYFIDNILNFSTNLSEILENKEYQVIDGYNIQQINSIIKLKEKLGREKDLKDIKIIKNYQLLNNINVLTLAYLGDAVYELYIRNYLIKNNIVKVNNLQKESIKYVSANGQASFLKNMIENNYLSDMELDIVKRAKNHKSHKCPKSTDVVTYKNATGLEALIGYLYLENNEKRINEIMEFIVGD